MDAKSSADLEEIQGMWTRANTQLSVACLIIGIVGGIAGGVVGAYTMRDEALRESRSYTDRAADLVRREREHGYVSKAELASVRENDRNRVELKLDNLSSKIERITLAVERLALRR